MLKPQTAIVGDILCYRAKRDDLIGGLIGFFSDLGRKQSNIVHVGVYAGFGRVIQSHLTVDKKTYLEGQTRSGCHMATIPESDYKLIDVYRVRMLEPQERRSLIDWMKSEYTSGYDIESFSESFYRSVLGRIFGWEDLGKRKPDDNSNPYNRYNCAEYVASAYKESLGIDIVPRLHPYNYTPADYVGRGSILKRVS